MHETLMLSDRYQLEFILFLINNVRDEERVYHITEHKKKIVELVAYQTTQHA